MKASIRKKAILLIIATFITLIFLAPNLWMLFGSFKSQNAMFALPPVWIPDFSYIKNFTIMLSESYTYLFFTYSIWSNFFQIQRQVLFS